LGIAQGLAYLHDKSQPCVVHGDMKAQNILLDKNLNPRIGDFGLAHLFPDEKSHLTTVQVAGTLPGYFSPEYAKSGRLTEKVDVYGFGVLVLEIVSGRKNTDFTLPKENVYLVEWVCTFFDLCKINGFKCFQRVQSWSISCDHSNLVCIVGWLYKIMFYGHGYRHGSCMRMGEYWILSK
jgi:serine/threonine protein kinase